MAIRKNFEVQSRDIFRLLSMCRKTGVVTLALFSIGCLVLGMKAVQFLEQGTYHGTSIETMALSHSIHI